jgi:hypothetical protein
MSAVWSLLGGKRTSSGEPISVENDPEQTFDLTDLYCALKPNVGFDDR